MLKHGGNFPEGTIDFSVNINPTVTKQYIDDLMVGTEKDVHEYPEIIANTLTDLLIQKNGIKKDCLIVGNGAIDCLYHVARTLKVNSVIIIEPTFSEYKRAFEIVGATVLGLRYNLNISGEKNEQQLLDQLHKIKADLVIVCNPNNPTGHIYSESFISTLLDRQKAHKGYVLVDESFRQFEGMKSSYTDKYWNLIVLMSLTKYYGIPGLRCGYLTSNVSLVQEMRKTQMPWAVNGVALHVMEKVLEDDTLIEQTDKWYCEEKAYMQKQLDDIRYLTTLPSSANYFLCKLEDVIGSEINSYLQNQDQPMAVRECDSFDHLGDDYIRIGLRSHEENEQLIKALSAYKEK